MGVSHSPTAKIRKQSSSGTLSAEMDFPDALRQVMLERKITKIEWNDPEIYVLLHNNKLCIKLKDGLIHELIVSDGDLFGKDWVVVAE